MTIIRTLRGLGFVAAMLVGLLSPSSGSAIQDLQPLVEGVYQLKESHTSNGVLTPPAIDGRFVLA